MGEWVACKSAFIEADVIRWHETIWERRGSRSAKPVKIATRIVTAQVLREDLKQGWVWLEIRDCAVTKRFFPKDTGDLKTGTEIKRQRTTIARGKPERLLWSDEDNRDRLVGAHAGRRSGNGSSRETKIPNDK